MTVRYMAMLREQRGASEERVAARPGETADELFRRLLPRCVVPVGYAINHAVVGGDTALADGDVLVFLPPVGGG